MATQAQAQPFAFVHGVKTNRHLVAICEVATYDVWGNARDGYEVNDVYRSSDEVRIPARVEVSNVPRFPVPAGSASFSCPVVLTFLLTDRGIRDVLGIPARTAIEVDGDDIHHYVTRERDLYPIGEITIIGWEDSAD
jgi:hypothetical protein